MRTTPRARALFSKGFTPARVASLEPAIARAAEALVRIEVRCAVQALRAAFRGLRLAATARG
ncbi:hypothetical protein ACSRUE_28005 [Sorangium sp. KYC3313]|uniref:hypothetical protein n=1 Tax=Sorangium sp. KYC3313 TaxID=3449740 RepID=UPI003F8AC895